MPEAKELLHSNLHEVFSERDPERRWAAIERTYTEDVTFIDPEGEFVGWQALSDAVTVEPDSTRLAADVSVAAQPWGGSYCSYQLGVDGPFRVMPALGPSMDEFNRRLARADGLKAEPDPKLGGAVNLVRPTLGDAERLHAAQRATAEQQASFETFTAQHGLNPRSLDVGLAPGTPRAL